MPTTDTRGDGAEGRSLERHTGADALLKFDAEMGEETGYVEIPVTDVSWTRDHTTEDVQHNGSQTATLTTTGIRFNGSFEYEGQNPGLLDAFLNTNDQRASTTDDGGRPTRGTLTIQEDNNDTGDEVRTISFIRIQATSFDRSYPADGVTNTSVDFEAEDMMINQTD